MGRMPLRRGYRVMELKEGTELKTGGTGALARFSTRTKLVCGVLVSLAGAVGALVGVLHQFVRDDSMRTDSSRLPTATTAAIPRLAPATGTTKVTILKVQRDVRSDLTAGAVPLSELAGAQEHFREWCPDFGLLRRRSSKELLRQEKALPTTPRPLPGPAPSVKVGSPSPRVGSPSPLPGTAPSGKVGILVDMRAQVYGQVGDRLSVQASLFDRNQKLVSFARNLACHVVPRSGEPGWADPVFIPGRYRLARYVQIQLRDDSGTVVVRSTLTSIP